MRDNTLLWIIGLGLGAYLLFRIQPQAAATTPAAPSGPVPTYQPLGSAPMTGPPCAAGLMLVNRSTGPVCAPQSNPNAPLLGSAGCPPSGVGCAVPYVPGTSLIPTVPQPTTPAAQGMNWTWIGSQWIQTPIMQPM